MVWGRSGASTEVCRRELTWVLCGHSGAGESTAEEMQSGE